MTSVDVARAAVQAAHVGGIKKGTSRVAGLSFFGVAVVGVAAVGVVVFLNRKADVDKKDAVFQAENRSFSSGVDTGKKEALHAQMQASKVMTV